MVYNKYKWFVPNNNPWGSKLYNKPWSLDKAVDDTVSHPILNEKNSVLQKIIKFFKI